MLNKNAKKWVKALLSGKYKQADGQLRDGDKFCCLGVACDLYAKEHSGYIWEGEQFEGEDTQLPPIVQSWLGLNTPAGGMDKNSVSLISYNDGQEEENIKKHTFKQIAKIIVKEPDGLFGKA